MNPAKVKRENIKALTDLPNVGPAMARDLNLIGIFEPNQLNGKSAYNMYDDLCRITGRPHDPCVLDIFLSITDFISGNSPKIWWEYTSQRKDFLSVQ